jgi:RNA polymerase sigma-70 factor (ECF subfamily)
VFEDRSPEDPEARFFEHIVDARIVAAIDALPDEYRLPLILSDLQGLKYREIAESLGVPVGTVKSRVFRARRQLQRDLYEYARDAGIVS